MKTLIVVPTYNEVENLPGLAKSVLAAAPDVDLLVVDDRSPDGTGDLADELARNNRRIRVLHRQGRLGLGTAYIEGFRYGLARGYDRLVEMDADFSHRPEDLPLLLEASHDAGVVIGSRWASGGRTENWSFTRNLMSRGGSLYARLMLDLPIKDCTSGFKCFRREALQNLDLQAVASTGFGFQVEMNYLCRAAGIRFAEVPIVFPNRTLGRSKMSTKIFLEALLLVWRLRFSPPSTSPGVARAAAARAASTPFAMPDQEAAGK